MAFTNPVDVTRTALSDGQTYTPTAEFIVLVHTTGTATYTASQDGINFTPMTVIRASDGTEVTSSTAATVVCKVPSGSPVIKVTGAAVTALGIS